MYYMNIFFNNNLLKINSIGIILFPITLISGPFLPDLLCTYFSIYFLFYIVKTKNFYLLDNKFFYYLSTIYIYVNLNSLFSFDPFISFKTSLTYIRVILFIFFIDFILKKNIEIPKFLYLLFFITISLMTIDSMFQFIFNINILGNIVEPGSRISSFFGDELIMGSYVSRFLPFMIGISYLVSSKNLIKFNKILIILSFILIILSAERVAFIYFCIFCFFYFLVNKKEFLNFFIMAAIFISLNIFYNSVFFDRIFKHTIFQLNQANSFLSYRHILHLKTAFDMFEDKKIIGHGLKSFRSVCLNQKYTSKIIEKTQKDKEIILKKFEGNKEKIDTMLRPINTYDNGCNTHPHNIYFEFLAELGIIGFILYFSMFVYFCIRFYKSALNLLILKIKKNIYYSEFFILIGICLSMMPMIPSGSYFNNWMLMISYFPIAFYLNIIRSK